MNMKKRYIVRMVCAALLLLGFATGAQAQELNARVKINHNQIQGTDNSVFEELGADLELTEEFVKMGIDELSVSPSMIFPVRNKIIHSKTK